MCRLQHRVWGGRTCKAIVVIMAETLSHANALTSHCPANPAIQKAGSKWLLAAAFLLELRSKVGPRAMDDSRCAHAYATHARSSTRTAICPSKGGVLIVLCTSSFYCTLCNKDWLRCFCFLLARLFTSPGSAQAAPMWL